jgi:hypothetical protein
VNRKPSRQQKTLNFTLLQRRVDLGERKASATALSEVEKHFHCFVALDKVDATSQCRLFGPGSGGLLTYKYSCIEVDPRNLAAEAIPAQSHLIPTFLYPGPSPERTLENQEPLSALHGVV